MSHPIIRGKLIRFERPGPHSDPHFDRTEEIGQRRGFWQWLIDRIRFRGQESPIVELGPERDHALHNDTEYLRRLNLTNAVIRLNAIKTSSGAAALQVYCELPRNAGYFCLYQISPPPARPVRSWVREPIACQNDLTAHTDPLVPDDGQRLYLRLIIGRAGPLVDLDLELKS